MRSEDAYKAEVFARRDAAVAAQRRRRRTLFTLLPLLCACGLFSTVLLRLPRLRSGEKTAEQPTAVESNGIADADTDDAMSDGSDKHGDILQTTVLHTTAALSPHRVYWAEDRAALDAYAESTAAAAAFAESTAVFDAAFFETHCLLLAYLTDGDADTLQVTADGETLTVSPQTQNGGVEGPRLLMQAVARDTLADCRIVYTP